MSSHHFIPEDLGLRVTKVNSVEKISEVFLNNRFLETLGATLVLNQLLLKVKFH